VSWVVAGGGKGGGDGAAGGRELKWRQNLWKKSIGNESFDFLLLKHFKSLNQIK
jgi:NAD(P)H-hydrate repair Nnr-like enzyme with NAD(P)H-hydrate epimerase domain